MAIKLYLSHQTESLLDKLQENLQGPGGDPFFSPPIILPNPNLAKWVKLRLADKNGISANLGGQYLESLLWSLLSQMYGLKSELPAKMLRVNDLAQFVFACFSLEKLESNSVLKKYLLPYLSDGTGSISPGKKVEFSYHLANLFLEYEYSRPGNPEAGQKGLLDAWPQRDFFQQIDYPNQRRRQTASNEIWQREIYSLIFGEGQMLDAFSKASGYELLSMPRLEKKLESWGGVRTLLAQIPMFSKLSQGLHLFGTSGLGLYHRQLIHRLSGQLDFYVYILNPCSQFWEDATPKALNRWERLSNQKKGWFSLKQKEEVPEELDNALPEENSLLVKWGKYGRESIHLWCQSNDYDFEYLLPENLNKKYSNIFKTLQRCIVLRKAGKSRKDFPPMEQDNSLQIWECPDKIREVENLWNSIIWNLKTNPSLKLNDIAVFVPNLDNYRSQIEQVFLSKNPGEPGYLPFHYGDGSAASSSYINAVRQIIRLLRGQFSRPEILEYFKNPLVRQKLSLGKEELEVWKNWISELNIYRSFDGEHRQRRGELNQELHSFIHGIKRLQLGRISENLQSFESSTEQDVRYLPYENFESSQRDLLENFCIGLESLYRLLESFQKKAISGTLHTLAESFLELLENQLEIPPELAGENLPKNMIWEAIENFKITKDSLPVSIGLEEFCEMVLAILPKSLPGSSSYLLGGLSISALAPMRPVPFKLVYLLGMGERDFPGDARESTLDLRNCRRNIGDTSPAEKNRYIFLESLLSVREKLYLSYVSRDLQKDEELLPSSCILELENFLEQGFLKPDSENQSPKFFRQKIPILPWEKNIAEPHNINLLEQNTKVDPLVNYKGEHALLQRLYSLKEYLGESQLENFKRTISQNKNEGYNSSQHTDIVNIPEKWKNIISSGELIPTSSPEIKDNIHILELKRFLSNPGEYKLSQSLGRIYDEAEDVSLLQDEPTQLEFFPWRSLQKQWFKLCLRELFSNNGSPNNSNLFYSLFEKLYAEQSLLGYSPLGAWSEMDKEKLWEMLSGLMAPLSSIRENFSNYRLAENMGYGQNDSRDSFSFSHQFEPARYKYQDISINIHGNLEYVLIPPDKSQPLLSLHFFGGKKRHKELLSPFLFYLFASDNPDFYTNHLGSGMDVYYLSQSNTKNSPFLLDKFCSFPGQVNPSQLLWEYKKMLMEAFLTGSEEEYAPVELLDKYRDWQAEPLESLLDWVKAGGVDRGNYKFSQSETARLLKMQPSQNLKEFMEKFWGPFVNEAAIHA